MIYAYARDFSIAQGETLYLGIRSTTANILITIYRTTLGSGGLATDDLTGGTIRLRITPVDSITFPAHDDDADWPLTPLDLSAYNFQPGLYVAMLWEIDPHGNVYASGATTEFDKDGNVQPRADGLGSGSGAPNLSGYSGRAPFLVRQTSPQSPILYKIPYFNYTAYNTTGPREGDNTPPNGFYDANLRYDTDPTTIMGSLRRAGNGTGGMAKSTGAVDDMNMLEWLKAQGIAVDVCSDLDIHLDRVVLSSYSLLLTTTHDEYWTWEERGAVEDFMEAGGNVAFFSGNICWKKVYLDRANNVPKDSPEQVIMRADFEYMFPGMGESPWSIPGGFQEDLGASFEAGLTNQDYRHNKDTGIVPVPLWWLNDLIIRLEFPQSPRIWSENRLIGQSYRNGGGRWGNADKEDPFVGDSAGSYAYHVQIDPSDDSILGSWAFRDTGLAQFDSFGGDDAPLGLPSGIAGGTGKVGEGTEVDGVFLKGLVPQKKSGGQLGMSWKATIATSMDDALTAPGNLPPPGYTLLAVSRPLDPSRWTALEPRSVRYPFREGKAWSVDAKPWFLLSDGAPHAAAMGIYRRNNNAGLVFHCGTGVWREYLDNDSSVQAITLNVIDYLSVLTVPVRSQQLTWSERAGQMGRVGATVLFEVDTSRLPGDARNYSYEWHITSGLSLVGTDQLGNAQPARTTFHCALTALGSATVSVSVTETFFDPYSKQQQTSRLIARGAADVLIVDQPPREY